MCFDLVLISRKSFCLPCKVHVTFARANLNQRSPLPLIQCFTIPYPDRFIHSSSTFHTVLTPPLSDFPDYLFNSTSKDPLLQIYTKHHKESTPYHSLTLPSNQLNPPPLSLPPTLSTPPLLSMRYFPCFFSLLPLLLALLPTITCFPIIQRHGPFYILSFPSLSPSSSSAQTQTQTLNLNQTSTPVAADGILVLGYNASGVVTAMPGPVMVETDGKGS